MALEKDFELLDDYLSNRLNESDKSAFEKKLEGDPALKQELKMQREFVDGLRQARVTELKSMLNNVPVPPISNPTSVLIKAGTWTVVSGLVLTGAYLYFAPEKDENQVAAKPETVTQPTNETPTTAENASGKGASSETPVAAESKRSETKKESDKPNVNLSRVAKSPSTTPEVKAYDPTKEAEEETTDEVRKYEQEQLEIISKAFVTSSIEVETLATDKQYKFHYVFKGGKLILFGEFERNLYEILEFINNDKKTVVLFFKTNYYLLDINKSAPTLLTPIRDKALLKKLSQYRGH
jgi:hypothetical protein